MTNKDYSILIIDDEEEMCLSLSEVLSKEGYSCRFTITPSEVETLIGEIDPDLIISDIRMPEIGGIDLLKKIKASDTSFDIIMITGFPTIDNAIMAMKYGAVNFYMKPLPLLQLKNEVNQLCKNRPKKSGLSNKLGEEIITCNEVMKKTLKTAVKASPTQAPILITGESGTGKEMIADLIHRKSHRSNMPFIKINCAAIAETLLESELLGHEKGAFTNAVEQKKGKFEISDGGSIFLDEIGDMSLKTQAKILRVLQQKEFERVGGTETICVDIRVIAATNKNLIEMIKQGSFREDLYYRLSVISIELPPLRRREGDVFILLNHFLEYFNNQYSKSISGFFPEAENVLRAHNWPGNIRELRNCVERAVIFCDGENISEEDLPSQYLEYSNFSKQEDIESIMDNHNRKAIFKALQENHGAKQKAADALNINRRTLYNRMKKLGLK